MSHEQQKAWVVRFGNRVDLSEASVVVCLNEATAVRIAADEAAKFAADEMERYETDSADSETLPLILAAHKRGDFVDVLDLWGEYDFDFTPDNTVEVVEAAVIRGPKDWTP